ncbi:uncharacterized protein BDW70DRAFT_106436 [Aspergillus foveolatus]|uniref:uncharacterized protein n=1 Tax=Aspergillus foveolatus TaxID=210207 RepID=UPI003CCCC492
MECLAWLSASGVVILSNRRCLYQLQSSDSGDDLRGTRYPGPRLRKQMQPGFGSPPCIVAYSAPDDDDCFGGQSLEGVLCKCVDCHS